MTSLISVSQLAALETGDLVVLDASIRRSDTGYESGLAEYTEKHVPGARFADLFTEFSDASGSFAFAAPGAEQFQAAARRVGVFQDSTVVVYDRLSGAWAARLWWLFTAFGIDRVFVLDGGLAAWEAAGRPVASGAPSWDVGDVTVKAREGFFVGLDEVEALSQHPSPESAVICALRGSEYDKGHIPHSSSLPYPSLLADDGTVDLARARAAAAGLEGLEGRVVLYCGGAINAAGLALALTEGGLPIERVTLYDGSLSEWKADPARPLIRTIP